VERFAARPSVRLALRDRLLAAGHFVPDRQRLDPHLSRREAAGMSIASVPT
jgi:hypothetical protein